MVMKAFQNELNILLIAINCLLACDFHVPISQLKTVNTFPFSQAKEIIQHQSSNKHNTPLLKTHHCTSHLNKVTDLTTADSEAVQQDDLVWAG